MKITALNTFVAPEFVYGVGARLLAVDYCKSLHMKDILVVSDPGVQEAGWTGEVINLLRSGGFRISLFTSVSENPRKTEVAAGAEQYLADGCNGILAVGGGSVIDCAKGIGVVVSHGSPVEEFKGVDKLTEILPPLVCIPTTAGSSADISRFAIITNDDLRVKFAVISSGLVPSIALIDPLTITTMDSELSTATGMDTLSHAFEAYVSTGSFFMTDGMALESVDLVARNLYTTIKSPKDIYARSSMMRASLLAGLAFSNASLGAVHALAHAVGGMSDLPHGFCNAVLLKEVVRTNIDSAAEAYSRLGGVLRAGLGLPPVRKEETVEGIVNALEILARKCGLDLTFKSSSFTPEIVHEMAVHAADDACLLTNPRQLGVADLEDILNRVI